MGLASQHVNKGTGGTFEAHTELGFSAINKDFFHKKMYGYFFKTYYPFTMAYEKTKEPFDKFLAALEARGVHEQKDLEVVNARLASASCLPGAMTRHHSTIIPAGVGNDDSWTTVQWDASHFLDGGSN